MEKKKQFASKTNGDIQCVLKKQECRFDCLFREITELKMAEWKTV